MFSIFNYFLSVLRNLASDSQKEKNGFGISVIIPFRKSRHYPRQGKNFRWIKKYIKCCLPWAEVISSDDPSRHLPFSKSAAINAGARKATGDILVLLDADGYVSTDSIRYCAQKIRKALSRNQRLWYVPYRHFFRLTDKASKRVLKSSPCHPFQFSFPPHPADTQPTPGPGYGHWFGALIQIVPREAFDVCDGWDERFRGWGGEDHSAMRATDTMYWPHKTLPGQVLHLWHPMLGSKGPDNWVEYKERLWDNQPVANSNGNLALRYSRANGDVEKMRKLMDERYEWS